jgi:nucleotide-binding universal stress UspA family protein
MTIVVGYIPNPIGASALEMAEAEATRRGDRLVVANLSKGDAFVDRKFASDDQLATVGERLTAAGVEHEIVQEVVPDIADALVELTERAAASLLVLGLRKRSPVGKLFLGSVAERVLLDVGCPVLTTKPMRA